MLIKRASSILSSEITPESVYKDRRRFMQGVLGLGAAAAVTSVDAAINLGTIHKAAPIGEEITDFEDATSYNNFYELGTGKRDPKRHAAELKTEPWTIKISGECDNPGTMALEDFLRPHAFEERIYRLRCVEGWSMVIPWVGFSLGDALKSYKPTSKAKFVEFVTIHDTKNLSGQKRRVLNWPYREGLRMDEAMNPLATLAVGMYGKVLPNQNGAPIRLVVPWKYGFKSIKSIVEIRFVEQQPVSTWEEMQPREYGFYSNVNPKVDHPRWSQRTERRIGEFLKRDTLMFNGYADEVAHLYKGMDLAKYY